MSSEESSKEGLLEVNPKNMSCGGNALRYGLKTCGTGVEAVAGGFVALGIGELVNDLWANNLWANFAAKHVIPAAGGGATFALLGTIFKYGLKFDQERRENPELTAAQFYKDNIKDAMLFMLGLGVFGGLAFGVFTSTAEITKMLNWQELSQDALAVGFGMITLGSQFSWLGLPCEKIAFDIVGVFSGFAGGAHLLKQDVVGKWGPAVIGGAAAVGANLLYQAGSKFCLWACKDNVEKTTGLINDTTKAGAEQVGVRQKQG